MAPRSIFTSDDPELEPNDPELAIAVAGAVTLAGLRAELTTSKARVAELDKEALSDLGTLTHAARRLGVERSEHTLSSLIGLLEARVRELEGELGMAKDSGWRHPCEDAIDKCFEIVDGKPEWDYPGQLVHLVQSLLEDKARVEVLQAEVAGLERDNAHLVSEFEDMRRRIEKTNQLREEMTTLRDTLDGLLCDR